MTSQVKTCIAYCLILCITVSIIPLNLFHHHEAAEIICNPTDVSEENDLCQQTIYHSDSFQNIQCDHQSHIDKDQEHCEFCQLLTTRHYNYLPPAIDWINPFFQIGEEFICQKSFSPYASSLSLLIRGPPA